MAKTGKYLVLAADPVEGEWSIIHQSDDADAALDFLNDGMPNDPSLRIAINTADFITYDTKTDDDAQV